MCTPADSGSASPDFNLLKYTGKILAYALRSIDMDSQLPASDLKTRLLRLVASEETDGGTTIAGSDGQDRVIARKPLWRRYWTAGGGACWSSVAGAAWLLAGRAGMSIACRSTG